MPGGNNPITGHPFIINDGMLQMPVAAQKIPIEKQIPLANQYNLAHSTDRMEFNDLLQRSFNKKSIIWSIDKAWTKDGDCVVAVFYSDIREDTEPKEDPEVVTSAKINPLVFDKETEDKADALFKEFEKCMDSDSDDDDSMDIVLEDDDDDTD